VLALVKAGRVGARCSAKEAIRNVVKLYIYTALDKALCNAAPVPSAAKYLNPHSRTPLPQVAVYQIV
jgi:hypothetical protein